MYFYRRFYEYDGALQVISFVVASVGIALVVGLICGFVGLCAAAAFVRIIYRNLKTD
jgi:ABC-type spermidine/putrescine transport system permease subunit II